MKKDNRYVSVTLRGTGQTVNLTTCMIKSYLHSQFSCHIQQTTFTEAEYKQSWMLTLCFVTMCGGCVTDCHLSEEPVELHAFGCGIAALNEARSAIHIHQALVVVVVNGGTEEPDVELLSTGVVHILQETPSCFEQTVLYVQTAGLTFK